MPYTNLVRVEKRAVIIGFMFGVLTGLVFCTATSRAQNMWQGSDPSGGTFQMYENSPGLYQWSNSQGQSGTIYQMPAPAMREYGRSPC